MRAGRAMCVVAAMCAVTAGVRAQTSSRMSPEEMKRMESYTHVPAEVKAFAAEYVAAWNAKSPWRVMSLNVPESRACITPSNKAVYEEVLATQMRDPVAPEYRLMLMPVNEGNLKAMAEYGTFPVKPERELHIDYEYPNSNDGGQVVVWLVQRNGRWVGDFPCMTAQGIQHYKDAAADRERYKGMAAGIKEPLRSELVAMLRRHQTGEAEERYKAATGCDMRTAMLVINALDGRMP